MSLSSWKRKPDNLNTLYGFTKKLVRYKTMGFTHVEIMPIMEHPYDGPGTADGIFV